MQEQLATISPKNKSKGVTTSNNVSMCYALPVSITN